MNVLVIEPGILPYEREINGLKEMQAVVGGPITAIYPWEDQAAVVCNDEALLSNMPFNRSVEGGYGGVFGPFFVCGLGEESFCSLTPEQVKTYKAKFRQAELLVGFRGQEPVTMKVPARPKETIKRNSRTQDRER